jgi:hypothetical protein
MLRRLIIALTTIAVLAGSIGTPVTVHACSMEGNAVKQGSTCSMCEHATPKAQKTTPVAKTKSTKSCCHNERRLLQIDPARTIEKASQLSPVAIILPFVVVNVEPPTLSSSVSPFLVDHPPPAEIVRNAHTWLNTARLLI